MFFCFGSQFYNQRPQLHGEPQPKWIGVRLRVAPPSRRQAGVSHKQLAPRAYESIESRSKCKHLPESLRPEGLWEALAKPWETFLTCSDSELWQGLLQQEKL